jgi:hypothetical protein
MDGLGVGSPGGLDAVAALGTGVLVHVIDPHGWFSGHSARRRG